MKLGYIDYLNCYPFYHYHFEKEKMNNVEIHPHYPSELNRKIAAGELHMSPISAAALSDCHEDVYVIPDFCLSSIGYVGSVILRSKIPIEDLTGKTIGLTNASKTSVILLKLLLKEFYKIEPKYIITKPNPELKGLDAALIIGNEAIEPTDTPVQFSYDLGELWLQKTGYPVVFAIFTVQKKFFNEHENEVKEVLNSYKKSLKFLETGRDELIEAARKKYPKIQYDIDNYYTILQFQFSDKLKEALLFYYDLAVKHNLIDPAIKIQYLNMDESNE